MLGSDERIRPEGEFEAYEDGDHGRSTDPLHAALLVRIDDEGRIEDHFRVALAGSGRLMANFRADRILDHPKFAAFTFRCEREPRSIRLRNNCFSSRWEDLEALVAGGGIHVLNEAGQDAAIAFREAWAEAKASKRPAAAATRWAIQASPAYGFRLTLEGLPRTANALRKDGRLGADNARTVELAGWTAPAEMLDRGNIKGPRPILFASNPGAARNHILERPERLKAGTKEKIPLTNRG